MSREKKYSWLEIFKTLKPFIVPYKKTIAISILLSGLAILVDLAEPVIYKHVLNDLAGVFVNQAEDPGPDASEDEIAEHREKTLEKHSTGHVAPRTLEQGFRTLIVAAVLLLVVNLLSHGLSLLSDYLANRYSSLLEQDFIEKLYAHVLRLKLSFLSKKSSAALAKQIDQTDEVGPAVTAVVQEISAQTIRLGGAVAIMLSQNLFLTLIALAIIPVYYFVARAMARRLEESSESYYEGWDDVASHLQSSLTNIKTVKVSGAEARVAKSFKDSLRKVNSVFLERNRSESFYIFAQSAVIQIGKFVVLAVGSWKVIEHQLTPGDVVMFVSLLDKMFDPIDELTSHASNLQSQKVSISRGLRLLHSRSSEPHGALANFEHNGIEFRDVSFSYTKERKILDGASFKIPAGKMTALVGPSGSGKTTISDLITRFYEIEDGTIAIGNSDISQVDPSEIRRNIGVVLADGAIFRTSLRDNIAFRDPDSTKEQIKHAVEGAGLSQTVNRLSKGLNTLVGEDGVGLSVGERQRVQIARILAAPPPIVVLDEATANLDYSTELEIRKNLRALKGSSTILTIAHRPAMVDDADHVVVVDAGHIVAEGPIEVVLKESEWFRKMMGSRNQE